MSENPYAAPVSAALEPESAQDISTIPAPAAWRRWVAALIDRILVGILQVVPLGIAINLFGDEAWVGLVNLLTMFGVPWVYYAVLESSGLQATFGKLAVGLRVVDVHGERITLGQGITRGAMRSLLLNILALLALVILLDKQGRGLWDMLAKTRVVERKVLEWLEV